MKTQILLTVEIDDDAQMRNTLPPFPPPASPATILCDVNDLMRSWAHANPYALRDTDHLRFSLVQFSQAEKLKCGSAEQKFVQYLENIANDVLTLARMARSSDS